MTLTTWDEELCKLVEPDVSVTSQRIAALNAFQQAGIPTVVWLCPLLPFINDTVENVAAIVNACRDAGVKGIINFGMGLTLRDGNRDYYYRQLDRHFPGMKERYIRTYGNSYELSSPSSEALIKLFHDRCEEYGIMHDNDQIFRYLFEFEDKQEQLTLY